MTTEEEIIDQTAEQEEKESKKANKTRGVLREPKVINRLLEAYEEHKNFSKVTEIINKEFGLSTKEEVIIRHYNKNKQREYIVDPSNTEFFENNFTETKKRWKEAWDMMSWLVKQVRDFQDMLDTQDKNQRVLMAIKSIPSLTTLSKSIIEQLQFLRKETEQIKINQKQFIYSPVQLNLELKKYRIDIEKDLKEKILDELIDGDFIEIKKDIPWYKKKKKVIELKN
ncbi:MAG: hypothetical protein ACFFG0_03255 [Candidatus Thorarchaeota archaeon]